MFYAASSLGYAGAHVPRLSLIHLIRKMFIGGLNWETTDRMYLVHRRRFTAILSNEQPIQNLFGTISRSLARFKNVQ